MSRAFEIVSKKEKYRNPWLVVNEYGIKRDGKPGIYGVVERHDSSVILATTRDGRTLFVKQYRFPTESYSWELPMGGVDAGETALKSARRELLEEAGLDLPLSKTGAFHPVPGLTPQHATVFSAVIPDSAIAQLESYRANVDEIVERRLLTSEEMRGMISSGQISDGFTLCALALAHYAAR